MTFKNTSFELLIDASVNCFFIKHYGLINFDTIAEGNKALSVHKDFKPDLNRLIDMTECTTDITSDEIRKLTKAVSERQKLGGSYKGAYIIDNSLGHGILRMFEALVSSPEHTYLIIDNREPNVKEKALNWLNLEHNYQFPPFLTFT